MVTTMWFKIYRFFFSGERQENRNFIIELMALFLYSHIHRHFKEMKMQFLRNLIVYLPWQGRKIYKLLRATVCNAWFEFTIIWFSSLSLTVLLNVIGIRSKSLFFARSAFQFTNRDKAIWSCLHVKNTYTQKKNPIELSSVFSFSLLHFVCYSAWSLRYIVCT